MTIELKVPESGESIQEVQILKWLKSEGDNVQEDEDVVELETDKASMDLAAPANCTLQKILKQEGEIVGVGEVIALFEEGGGKPKAASKSTKAAKKAEEPKPAAATSEAKSDGSASSASGNDVQATPSGRRELLKHGLNASDVSPTGKTVRREDVEKYVESISNRKTGAGASSKNESELEEVIPMSLIRRRIAQRLVQAQQKAALLTTFNQVDMSYVMDLRKRHGESFQKRYGVKLGFMSFFTKALIDALKAHPELNAEIRDETNIVYRNYFHIGIAVGSGKGLVVPVLKFAERMSFAEIEQAIQEFAGRAKSNQLKPEELSGGTFTISNGGVYGSMLSTPIVNPPQSGVLGMHAIEERPIALNGQVVIRPMMYLALTYDHRIVDGREAVTFLRRVKEAIEEPSRMLIEA
ncbi:2-oxoglutarate dehydrogenase complex dihydrolipoyllysine-residue succinyltransferase [Bremerella cremea]|uniref:Dihydrolipoyllysine-residue succinyltransferase n=1 Tax=Blastopirellula marina TaxID=124 RepID=A0A2S8G7Z6_9BACT|nr:MULTISPECIES: 2-oxoglutarate dehydrogenase complex dihydrolipoyllysine-residue succinyltransferase [Pirellulaceae]PQO40547.1 dihydrolipoyllysine-residue succinyltransferase [Blastopirellula marina]RCS52129.1 2-oxoglutarate dehydrogenase complex dihydrolipoyllysine-residue succinyltransferase [Bremerella cremea]